MLRYLSIGALMLSSATAMAEGPSYSYIQASYQETKIDFGGARDADGDGYGVSASFEIDESWFVFGSYGSSELESVIDLDQFSVGGGWHSAINENTDWFAALSYISADVSARGLGSASESGFGASVGLRSNLKPNFELYGSLGYSDLGDGADGTEVGAGFWYTVTGNLAIGLGAAVGSDVTSYGAGIRLYFDK